MDGFTDEDLGAWAGVVPEAPMPGAAADTTGDRMLSGAEFARECADRLDTLVEDLKAIRAAGDFPKKFSDLAEKLIPNAEKLRDLADEYEEKHGELSMAEREALASEGVEADDEEEDIDLSVAVD